jgi:hypothetical protein
MRLAVGAVLFVLALSRIALAQTVDSPPEADESGGWDGGYHVKATRRSDFMLGGSAGLTLGNGYGYPNEVDKIDNPAYVADTGAAFGTTFDLWLGGALRDWLNFGLGVKSFGIEGSDQQLSGFGFIFRIEAFPFFAEDDKLQDVGMLASFGLGGAQIERDGDQVADGGAVSIVGFGAFWEPWRFGGFAAGPSIDYSHLFSQSLYSYAVTGGIRLAFYAGP